MHLNMKMKNRKKINDTYQKLNGHICLLFLSFAYVYSLSDLH